MSLVRSIPNVVTGLNLVCGGIAVACAHENHLFWSGIFIFAAAFFDFLDGLLARLLNAVSEPGKTFDSMADLISFGMAPSLVLYQLMKYSLRMQDTGFDRTGTSPAETAWLFLPMLVLAATAYRLARFNLLHGRETSFRGLPAPACGILVASLGMLSVLSGGETVSVLLMNKLILLILIILLAFLMVSGIRMFSFKFKHFSFRGNEVQYIFLIIAGALLLIFHLGAVPLIILFYIIVSILFNLATKKRQP